MSAAVALPSLTMKFPCAVDTRAPPARLTFQPGTIDERASRSGDAFGHVVPIGVLKNATGARSVERLRLFSVSKRLAGHFAKRCRIAGRDAEHGRQKHFAGFLQAASIVPEFHLVAGKITRCAVSSASRTDSTSSLMRRPPKCAFP